MKITDTELRHSNPFAIEGLETRTHVVRENKKIRTLVDTDTGEVFNTIKLKGTAETITTDSFKYTKLFNKNLPTVGELTVPELKVMTYIMDNLIPNRDYVTVHIEDCAEWCGYKSSVQVYKGLIGLIEKNLIARGKNTIYWINPNIFYNGDRTQNKTYTR